MVSAFVLITTKFGRAEEVAYKLMRMQNIKHIETVQGEYDIIVEIDAKNELKLDNIMRENIKKLKNVELVSPLIVRNDFD